MTLPVSGCNHVRKRILCKIDVSFGWLLGHIDLNNTKIRINTDTYAMLHDIKFDHYELPEVTRDDIVQRRITALIQKKMTRLEIITKMIGEGFCYSEIKRNHTAIRQQKKKMRRFIRGGDPITAAYNHLVRKHGQNFGKALKLGTNFSRGKKNNTSNTKR